MGIAIGRASPWILIHPSPFPSHPLYHFSAACWFVCSLIIAVFKSRQVGSAFLKKRGEEETSGLSSHISSPTWDVAAAVNGGWNEREEKDMIGIFVGDGVRNVSQSGYPPISSISFPLTIRTAIMNARQKGMGTIFPTLLAAQQNYRNTTERVGCPVVEWWYDNNNNTTSPAQ